MLAYKSQQNALSINFRNLLVLFVATLFLYSNTVFAETSPAKSTENPEQELHVSLVLMALKLDFYNSRCRGLSVAKNFNKVNRLYITKYSLTANNFIKQYINNDVRQEKATQEIEFKKTLNSLGGCAKAKEQGWIKEIHDEYKIMLEQAEKSTWFPEES